MPIRINDVPLVDIANVALTHQLVATDPSNFDLRRIEVSSFRGASVFTGDIPPANVPANPNIPSYITGDTYIENTTQGKFIYTWDGINNVWGLPARINGMRIHTSTDFPTEVDLDLRDTNFVSNDAYENDSYLNTTLDLLFDSYSSALGWNFSGVDYENYQGLRAPRCQVLPANPVLDINQPSDYLTAFLQLTDVDPVEQASARLPIHGDKLHINITPDNGHGGWQYTWDSSIPATGGSNLANYNLKFGADGLGSGRSHFREAGTFNVTTVPVQDNSTYREGDNVFNVNTGVLYWGYIEDYTNIITDVANLFQGQTTLVAGSGIQEARDDTTGNWITPAFENKWTAGDIVLTRDNNTPRILGFYDPTAATAREAWPILAVLRPPVTHEVASTAPIPVDTVDAVTHPILAGTMVVEGDRLAVVYPTVDGFTKRREYEDGVVIALDTSVPATPFWTMAWGGFINGHHFQIYYFDAVGEEGVPPVNNDQYSTDDLARSAIGDWYRYDETGTTGADAGEWVLLRGLRANLTHQVDAGLDTNFTPSTTQSDVSWGGVAVQEGDTLQVNYGTVGTPSAKVVLYTATDVDLVLDTVTWGNRRSFYGNQTIVPDPITNTDPVADNVQYATGEFYVSGSGRRFVYDESADSNAGGWSFLNWERSATTFSTSQVNTWTPTVVNDALTIGAGSVVLMVGDIIKNNVNTSTNGKAVEWVVIGEGFDVPNNVRTVALSARYNPNTRTFTESVNTHPLQDDNNYSNGDWLENPVTNWRYQYVEFAADDATAWVQFNRISASDLIDTDADGLGNNVTLTHQLNVDQGLFFFEEQ
ncbi:hypothetical protein NVP1121O_029 [Vibrio phage 1.121.O._10N.286.46.C4]|nr:hypothetical protein NVP1121O_029 [Vibrio phage 1.121.O._10N.286.46.C4]